MIFGEYETIINLAVLWTITMMMIYMFQKKSKESLMYQKKYYDLLFSKQMMDILKDHIEKAADDEKKV